MKVVLKKVEPTLLRAIEIEIGETFLIASDVQLPIDEEELSAKLRMRLDAANSLSREPAGSVLAIVLEDGELVTYNPDVGVLPVKARVLAEMPT